MPEDLTLQLLRELRTGQEQMKRQMDRMEGELINLREREQARTIDINRIDRGSTSRDDRLREIEDRLDGIEKRLG